MERFLVKKHWTSFKNGKVIVNCPTEDLAKQFLGYCEEKGVNWRSGDLASTRTYFEDLGDQVCYDTTLLDGMTRASIWEHQMYAPEIPILQFQGFGSLKKSAIQEKPEVAVKADSTVELVKGMLEGEYALECDTEELAKELLTYIASKGYRWHSGNSLLATTNFGKYTTTSYATMFAKGKTIGYTRSDFYTENGIEVKKFTGFKNEVADEPNQEQDRIFVCPECGNEIPTSEWDAETKKVSGYNDSSELPFGSILEAKNFYLYNCPKCGEEVIGMGIQEVFPKENLLKSLSVLSAEKYTLLKNGMNVLNRSSTVR